MLLNVSSLSVRYGGTVAVDEVTFGVPNASFVGLIGPNGAGKTSLIDALTGYTPYSGAVDFEDSSLSGMRPHSIARRGLSRTFQTAALFDDLTVLENLLVGSYRGSLKGLFRSVIHQDVVDGGVVDQLLDYFELQDSRNVQVRHLSTGTRRLVGIARALAAEPKMLLLDEPAAGLDTHESEELGRLLRKIRSDGLTMLLIDHDMNLVLNSCDEVHVLNFGHLIASGTPKEIQGDSAVRLAYLGEGIHSG
jgi:branched-chain amino acid transport system ATP-binding protein